MGTMGDPFGLRDDDCWKCIIEELRKANQSAIADQLQAALDSPIRRHELDVFENLNPGYQLYIDPAVQICRFEGRCQW
jgi:hypothetical protein